MKMRPLLVAYILVLACSIVGQVMGARSGGIGLSAFAAAAAVGGTLRVAHQINRPFWEPRTPLDPELEGSRAATTRVNGLLIALGYAWAGVSMQAVYALSGLKWQHGWQYGTGMLLIAAIVTWVMKRLNLRDAAVRQRLMWLTIAHCLAATVAFAWLVLSGKIVSPKDDWAANIVFAAGACIVAGLSFIGLRTARMLGDLPSRQPVP